MALQVETKLNVPNIEIQIDDNNEFRGEQLIKHWGPNVPVVKINDYVVPPVEILSYDVYVSINNLMRFELSINDEANFVKDSLKSNELNEIVIFIGNANWYHRYLGVILDSDSNENTNTYNIEGVIYPEKLFETEQKKYDEKSVNEILKLLAENTDIGYFSNDNESLNYKIPEIINANETRLNFIKYVITKFTNNIWSIDANGILHVGNLQSFVDKPISKINYYKEYKLPKPLELTVSNENGLNGDNGEENVDDDFLEKIKKLAFRYYSIDDKKVSIFNKEYSIHNELGDENKLYLNDYGFGSKTENYFSGFKDKYFPNYTDLVNKQLTGKVINITMENNFYEIHPFMTLNLELFTNNKELTKEPEKNEIDSGKKVLIGYSYHYKQNSQIIQKIKLI